MQANTLSLIYPEMFLYQAESADQQTTAPSGRQDNEEQLISEEEEVRLENRRVAVTIEIFRILYSMLLTADRQSGRLLVFPG